MQVVEQYKYAGAGWIGALAETKGQSELGIAVADLLGDVFLGIYHIDSKPLRKVDWSNTYFIEVPINSGLCTVDFNHLTRLMVLAHDRMLRVNVEGLKKGWLLLQFHQRHSRTGQMSERYPTIEDHAARLRASYQWPPAGK